MKRILVFVLLSLSAISFGSYKLGILSFESPYSIHFYGLTEDLVFADDQGRSYQFSNVIEPELSLKANKSSALEFGIDSYDLQISVWFDTLGILGAGRNEFRIGWRKGFFEAGIGIRTLFINITKQLAWRLADYSYYMTIDGTLFDPTQTEVLLIHRINDYCPGIYFTAYFGNFWFSIAGYPFEFSSIFEERYLKISDDDNEEKIYYPGGGSFSFSNDEFSFAIGWSFKLF